MRVLLNKQFLSFQELLRFCLPMPGDGFEDVFPFQMPWVGKNNSVAGTVACELRVGRGCSISRPFLTVKKVMNSVIVPPCDQTSPHWTLHYFRLLARLPC